MSKQEVDPLSAGKLPSKRIRSFNATAYVSFFTPQIQTIISEIGSRKKYDHSCGSQWNGVR